MELPRLSTHRENGQAELVLEQPRCSREEVLSGLLRSLLLVVGPGVLLYAAFFLISGLACGHDGKPVSPLWSWLLLIGFRAFFVAIASFFFWAAFTSFTRQRFIFRTSAGTLEVQRLMGARRLWRRSWPLQRLRQIVVGITGQKASRDFTVEIQPEKGGSLLLWTCSDLKDAERVADRVSKFTGVPFTNRTERLP